MARDEALFLVGEVPTLRFFSWRQLTLSLGRYQKSTELNFAFLEERGITIVRRPTGGRAILHGDEVTLSFFLPQGEVFRSHRLLYSVVQEVLRKALFDNGVEVDNSISMAPSVRSPVCFSLALPHELVVSGKKVAGVAQARSARGNLFEGSLPFVLDRALFASCFWEKEKIYQELLEGALGLQEIQSALTKEKLVAAMIARFGELFDRVYFDEWSEKERKKTEELLAGKYAPSSPYHRER